MYNCVLEFNCVSFYLISVVNEYKSSAPVLLLYIIDYHPCLLTVIKIG